MSTDVTVEKADNTPGVKPETIHGIGVDKTTVMSEEDQRLLARRQYEQWARARRDKMGLGFQHQVKKRVEKIKAQMAKWKHSDPQYGQKLAIAMSRLSELKRSVE